MNNRIAILQFLTLSAVVYSKMRLFWFLSTIVKVSLLSIEFSLKCGTTKASGYRTTVFILLWIVKLESYFPPPPLAIEYRTRICDKIDTWKAAAVGDFRYIIPAALFLINSKKSYDSRNLVVWKWSLTHNQRERVYESLKYPLRKQSMWLKLGLIKGLLCRVGCNLEGWGEKGNF